MQRNNTVFLNDKELADVVVSSDSRGNHNIMSSLKYNRLVNVQCAAHSFNKNTLLVRGTELRDTIVVSDCHGNSTIKKMNEETIASANNSEERNLFMEVLHRVQSERNQASIDSYLEKKRSALQENLKMATELYIAGNYTKAREFYRYALTMIESDSYPDEFLLEKSDVFRIKYALTLSNMGMNLYGPLKTACEMLSTLILTYGAEYPSLYYTLGRAKVMLKLFDSARIVLETGLTVLDECVVLSHLTFPASNHIIPDTDPTTLLDNLEKLLEESSNVPKPDVKCCYRLCIADSRAIYFNGPSFIGYVNVTCSERCQLNYHRPCWKVKLKTDRVKKPSTILNQPCKTDDCRGVISEIKIFDQHLKVNAAIRTKTERETGSSDYVQTSSVRNIVESRVYKAHFQLPTPAAAPAPPAAAVSSNLKPNATAFTPGKLNSITLLLKNPSKRGPEIFDNGIDDEESSEKTVQQSSLKPDVPEFLPSAATAATRQSVNETVNLTKWSTNAESTLATGNASDYLPSLLMTDCNKENSNYSAWRTVTPFSKILFDQPTSKQDGDCDLKPTADKVVWTEPVTTQSVTTQCQVDTSSRQTQTVPGGFDKNELLRCQINNLKYALYRAEDANNRLLLRHKVLFKNSVTAATQTENIIDKRQKNCLKWIHNTCTPAICHADILHTSNQKLEDELKELKKLSRVEKDCFQECKTKYCKEITDLQSTVAELKSQLATVRTEFRDYKKNNTMLSVNKILLEQIQCNKNFYLPYLKTFEDKCKHMIWELEDLQALTTVEGTPSKAEVEESLSLWRSALGDVESRHRIVMQHYETLLYNITSHQYSAILQYPGQKLLVEPPNIMLRHFKPMLIVNRRLDQDIANQMNSFYKILSQSHTNVYPQQVELQNNIDLASSEYRNAKPAVENAPKCSVKAKMSEKSVSTATGTSFVAAGSTNTLGAIAKVNKTRQNRAAPEMETVQSVSTVKRPMQDIVGLDALVDKLQSQFPLTDGTVITEALFSIRGQHGGLSGMSSKDILTEVKKYLRVKQQKTTVAPPAVNPWNTINTPVQWDSDGQDSSCTICFEKMARDNSVKLRCQHVFHCTCIKIWLHSNSICPICRSFTTLDDEFPPL